MLETLINRAFHFHFRTFDINVNNLHNAISLDFKGFVKIVFLSFRTFFKK